MIKLKPKSSRLKGANVMIDEFDFIKSIKPKVTHHDDLIMGIGDDAALYRVPEGAEQIVCTDTMVEDIHFSRETMDAFQIGWKALAANISDIAAMGGVPDYYLVSIAMPEAWQSNGKGIFTGMEALASRYKMDLIGGDTVSARHGLVLSITVIGHVLQKRYFLREHAESGDIVFVTGTFGDSAAGLALLQGSISIDQVDDRRYFIQRHQLPNPQVEAAKLMATMNARFAVNDISDGLASEANEIAEASQVSIKINYDCLPKSEAMRRIDPEHQREFLLHGGEDYQLLVTAAQCSGEHFMALCHHAGVQLTEIGKVTEGNSDVILIIDGIEKKIEKTGYNHFKKNEG